MQTLQHLSHTQCIIDYTSFKQTVHPNDFENKSFMLNTCLLSGRFQTDKKQTKAETIEQDVRWQGLSSKHLFLELLGAQFA